MGYDNNMSGVLFKNDKEGNENRPDYKGKCEINGDEFWISAWVKTSKKSGKKFLSLSFQEKEKQYNENTDQYQVPEPMEDDLPF